MLNNKLVYLSKITIISACKLEVVFECWPLCTQVPRMQLAKLNYKYFQSKK